MRLVPIDEVIGLIGIGAPLAVAIDVRERGDRDPMPLVRDQIAERLKAVERAPLGKLRAVDLFEQLADRLAEREC